VYSVAFSPNGKLSLRATSERCAVGRDHGQEPAQFSGYNPDRFARQGHVGVCALAFSPDGEVLAVGEGDKTIRLWEAETGKKYASSGSTSPLFGTWLSRPTARH
jgi:WD40 repeat protein